MEVVVCMGSSCFPRGNSQAAEWLMGFIQEEGLEDRIRVTGTLCQNLCKQGPNVKVADVCHCGMHPEALALLLREKLASMPRP